MANLLDLPPELLQKIYDWLPLIEHGDAAAIASLAVAYGAGNRSGPYPGEWRKLLTAAPRLVALSVNVEARSDGWYYVRTPPSRAGGQSPEVAHVRRTTGTPPTTATASHSKRSICATLRHFRPGQLRTNFAFQFPLLVDILVIKPANFVPLGALVALLTPGTPSYASSLERIDLDLPFAGQYVERVEGMTVADLTELEIDAGMSMEWTAEVSDPGLRGLMAVVAERGVVLAGNCTAVWDLAEAVGIVEDRLLGGGFHGTW